jgi:acyl-CoA hydrolase
MDPRPASDSESLLVHSTGALDANSAGNVVGGTVLRLCDEVAVLAALRHARRRVVTAAVDRVTFLHTVTVGEVLTLKATVNAAWRTSMEVGVRVEAEQPVTGERRHTSTAYLTIVALDRGGRPTPIPPLLVQTPEQERREREAQTRRRIRLSERDEILASRDS